MTAAVVAEPTAPARSSPGESELLRLPPTLLRLAERSSIAVRVEPALLRALRLGLRPRVGVAAEADLWFSPLTGGRSRTGFTFRTEIRHALQARLAADAGALAHAWRVTRSVHVDAPALMRFEEELVWLALSGEPDSRLAERLEAVIVTMRSAPERNRGLSQWIVRALPRLPPRIQELEQVWMLAVAASARLGGRRVVSGSPPEGARRWMSAVLPEDVGLTSLGVRLSGGHVELQEPAGSATEAVTVPATDPVVIELLPRATSGRPRQIAVPRGGSVRVEVPLADLYLRTATGDVYLVGAGGGARASHRVRRSLDFEDELLPVLGRPTPLLRLGAESQERVMGVLAVKGGPRRGEQLAGRVRTA